MFAVTPVDWRTILRALEGRVSPTLYRTWFMGLKPVTVPPEEATTDGPVVLACGSQTAAHYVESKFGSLIEEVVRDHFGRDLDVIFIRQAESGSGGDWQLDATRAGTADGAQPGAPIVPDALSTAAGALGDSHPAQPSQGALPARQIGTRSMPITRAANGAGAPVMAGHAAETARPSTGETQLAEFAAAAGAAEALDDDSAMFAAPQVRVVRPAPEPATQGQAFIDPPSSTAVAVTAPYQPAAPVTPQPAAGEGVRTLAIPINPAYTFETFVVGKANRMAHVASLTVAEQPGTRYNPLFLYGSVGLGKTHLLQAIAQKLKAEYPHYNILYQSCESFLAEYIRAVEAHTIDKFQAFYRSLDCLILDDIHYLVEKDRTQEEFFHTFNALTTAQKQIVISSDTAPSRMQGVEDRLISRFKGGAEIEIEPPDFETRVAIFKRKAMARGMDLDRNVLHFLAEQFTKNVREMEGAVKLLDAAMEFIEGRQNLSIGDVERILSDVLQQSRGPRPMLSLDAISRHVGDYFGIKLKDLQSKRRTKTITLPRQVCMFLAHQRTEMTLGEIGAFFGGRDHSTVIHAIRKIDERVDKDIAFKNLVQSFDDALSDSR